MLIVLFNVLLEKVQQKMVLLEKVQQKMVLTTFGKGLSEAS